MLSNPFERVRMLRLINITDVNKHRFSSCNKAFTVK